MARVIYGPPWRRCSCCPDYLCMIHDQHVHDCPCPPIEDWAVSPYQEKRSMTSVSPHEFEPLVWWDTLLPFFMQRCTACLVPRCCHPTRAWVPARAIGDRSRPMRCEDVPHPAG